MPDRSALALQLTDAIGLARAAVEHAGDRAFRAYGLSHRAHAVLSAVDLGGPDGARPKDVATQLDVSRAVPEVTGNRELIFDHILSLMQMGGSPSMAVTVSRSVGEARCQSRTSRSTRVGWRRRPAARAAACTVASAVFNIPGGQARCGKPHR